MTYTKVMGTLDCSALGLLHESYSESVWHIFDPSPGQRISYGPENISVRILFIKSAVGSKELERLRWRSHRPLQRRFPLLTVNFDLRT